MRLLVCVPIYGGEGGRVLAVCTCRVRGGISMLARAQQHCHKHGLASRTRAASLASTARPRSRSKGTPAHPLQPAPVSHPWVVRPRRCAAKAHCHMFVRHCGYKKAITHTHSVRRVVSVCRSISLSRCLSQWLGQDKHDTGWGWSRRSLTWTTSHTQDMRKQMQQVGQTAKTNVRLARA